MEGPLDPPWTRAQSELTDRPAGGALGPRSLGPPSLCSLARSLPRPLAQQEEARWVWTEAALRAAVAAAPLFLFPLSPPHRLCPACASSGGLGQALP